MKDKNLKTEALPIIEGVTPPKGKIPPPKWVPELLSEKQALIDKYYPAPTERQKKILDKALSERKVPKLIHKLFEKKDG